MAEARRFVALACIAGLFSVLNGCGGRTGVDDNGTTVGSAASGGVANDDGSPTRRDGGSGGDGASGGSDDAGRSPPPSCAAGGDGVTNCGSGVESCCASFDVEGGTYYRTYTNAGNGPTGEADLATVSGFRLDKYDVTVGRFRQFVSSLRGGNGWLPATGSGKHVHLNEGLGLANSANPGTYETGWLASDDSNIAPSDAHLACDTPPGYSTWKGATGTLPINCVNWYEAYAFCIWDGGFLPSEAEWEYAAAGGSAQLEYPWGATSPGTSSQLAIYGCYYPPSGPGTCTGLANIPPVGTAIMGAGLWHQLDLVGEVSQWNLDGFGAYLDPCVDCGYVTAAAFRVHRGGVFFNYATTGLLPPDRYYDDPSQRYGYVGFRCARTP
jgi:sulfatase modifying factor 1